MTIATIRRVPVDLIIHSLAERFKESTEEGHDRLAMGLYACIDSNGLAEEWAVSGGVAQTAEWMATAITGRDSWREPTAAETRVAEVAVCKRLLATACNLCVTQGAEDHAAATALVRAALRILDVDVSRVIRTSADVEGYEDAMALQAAREQLQAALGRTPDAPPLTLRELINCLASKHTAAAADAVAKDGFRAEMHAAIGREMEMRKQVAAMQDQFAKVRDIFDKALGTTKGATTFTLTDIAEEMACAAFISATFKRERDAHAATIENLRRVIMGAGGEVAAPPAKTKPQPGDVVPWAETEDGCMYADNDGSLLAQCNGRCLWLWSSNMVTLPDLLSGDGGWLASDSKDQSSPHAILVARDLGTDPEVWRKAMREWTANGNKPAAR